MNKQIFSVHVQIILISGAQHQPNDFPVRSEWLLCFAASENTSGYTHPPTLGTPGVLFVSQSERWLRSDENNIVRGRRENRIIKSDDLIISPVVETHMHQPRPIVHNKLTAHIMCRSNCRLADDHATAIFANCNTQLDKFALEKDSNEQIP